MKIWLDAHLPPSITPWLQSTYGIKAVPIRDLGLRDEEDSTLFTAARKAEAVLKTKEIDIRCTFSYHHDIMARTTVDIDGPLLKELKSLQRKERQSLGKLMSQLLAEALSRRKKTPPASKLHWVARPMEARIDITDKETLYNILDETSK